MTPTLSHCLLMVGELQSHVILCDDPFDCNGQDVIICITGNPGLVDFYKQFALELHNRTKLPVCVIGHAGHEVVPHERSNKMKGQEHMFDLEGQLKHKADFIYTFIDPRSKLHLIGHSIGAWLILEMLQNHERIFDRVSSVNLLFPTLHQLANTKNGRFINNFVKTFHSIVLFLFFLADLLPDFMLFFLVKLYLKFHSSYSMHNFIGVNKLLNVHVGEKVLFLAYDEMSTVKEMNIAVINKIKHMTNIIYSTKDGWVPVSYMEELKQLEPEIQMIEVDIDHAFVMKSSIPISKLVAQYINNITGESSD